MSDTFGANLLCASAVIFVAFSIHAPKYASAARLPN